MSNYPEIFKTYPAVYAVRDRYVIIVAVNEPCTMWVKVGNGIPCPFLCPPTCEV